MNNIFENAYFGKPYKTRDGRKALFVNWDSDRTAVFLYVEERDIEFYGEEMYDLDGTTSKGSTPHDIISEWQEEINEEELDKLADKFLVGDDAEYIESIRDDHPKALTFGDIFNTNKRCFKAGYRKALEI